MPRSDIENTRTAARIEAAAKVYWEIERSRQTNDDVPGYLKDLLRWENAPAWMQDLIRTRMTAALAAADEASAVQCPRCAGSRIDPDSQPDYHHGVAEPGSFSPCEMCRGKGTFTASDLPAMVELVAFLDKRAPLSSRLAEALRLLLVAIETARQENDDGTWRFRTIFIERELADAATALAVFDAEPPKEEA